MTTAPTEIIVRVLVEYPPAPQAIAADPPLAYDLRESARLLGISRSTVQELVRRGEIESIKIGAARRILRSAIEAYIAGRQADGGDDG